MGKFSIDTKKQYVISEETAIEQIKALLAHYDIDVDIMSKNSKARESMETTLDKLVSYVRDGKLSVENADRFEIVQILAGGEKVVYKEVGAIAKLAMDSHEQNQTYRRIYALMGSLSGLGDTAIQKFSAKDLAVVEVLGAVLMSA